MLTKTKPIQQPAFNRHILLLVLLTLILAGALVNHNVLGPSTLVAYFLYTITAALLAGIVGLTQLKGNRSFLVPNPAPLFFFVLLTLFYVIQGLLNNKGLLSLRHYFLLIDCLLLLACCLSFVTGRLLFQKVCIVITLLAGAEAVICLLQYVGWINSQNSFFKVTGTWVNPNVIASFLALSIPAVLLVLFEGKTIYRQIGRVVLGLCLIALFLLQCRTALIGTVVVLAIVYNWKYDLLSQLKQRFRIGFRLVLSAIMVGLLIVVGFYFYNSKKESADGRSFIWKISFSLIREKPLTGVGYGRFEHDYNLAQARYFKDHNAEQQEINNASFVRMAYNEFLENAVEGGIAGLLLFTGLLFSLVIRRPVRRSSSKAPGIKEDPSKAYDSNSLAGIAAYAGIAAFSVMSVFNFTVQAIPVMGVFILYAAYHITNVHVTGSKNNNRSFPARPVAITLSMVSLLACMVMLLSVTAYIRNKIAHRTFKEGNRQEAIGMLVALENELKGAVYYWQHYGNLLYEQKKYDLAVDKFAKATAFSSDPDLYLRIGNCYYKTGEYTRAEAAYLLALNMVPNRFKPRYALMKLYLNRNDTAHVLHTAAELVALQPKVPSREVTIYKKEAQMIIQQLTEKNGNN